MLYYGSLSSRVNLDLIAKTRLEGLRRKLGVSRLHANELGNAGIAAIGADLHDIQCRFNLRFDVFRVAKPDHAVICFFDQVFDQAMNPAMTWTGYWTPLRYMLLIKVAMLFDEDLTKQAWAARIEMPLLKFEWVAGRSKGRENPRLACLHEQSWKTRHLPTSRCPTSLHPAAGRMNAGFPPPASL